MWWLLCTFPSSNNKKGNAFYNTRNIRESVVRSRHCYNSIRLRFVCVPQSIQKKRNVFKCFPKNPYISTMAITNPKNICTTMYLRKIHHKMRYIKRRRHHWLKMFSKVAQPLYSRTEQRVQVNSKTPAAAAAFDRLAAFIWETTLYRFQVKLIRCLVQIHEKPLAHRNHHRWNFHQKQRCLFKRKLLKVV